MSSDWLRFTLVAFFALLIVGVGAGDLEPPSAPSSTLIPGLRPATPLTAEPVTIEESGVYYLTESIIVSSEFGSAITIRTDDVVIDLGGYSLIGPGTGTGRGVSAEVSVRATVRNGTIRDFGNGGAIFDTNGTVEDLRIDNCAVGFGLSPGGIARRVQITGCEVAGIEAVNTTEIIDCSVSDCGLGIVAFASSVTRCTVQTSERFGITAIGPSIVSDCRVIACKEEGFLIQGGAVLENSSALLCATGILGEGGATIRSCTAAACSVEGIAVAGSEGSSLIADCHVQAAPIGIRVNQPATVVRNYVTGAATEAIQISAPTTDVTVLDNTLMNTPTAIHHLGFGDNCFYARNTYTGGASLGPSGTWGPLVTGVGSLSDDVGGNHPWANIRH